MAGITSRGWAFALAFTATAPCWCAFTQATGELTGVTADPSNQAVVGANLQAISLQTNTDRANGIEQCGHFTTAFPRFRPATTASWPPLLVFVPRTSHPLSSR